MVPFKGPQPRLVRYFRNVRDARTQFKTIVANHDSVCNNNRIAAKLWDLGASGVGPKVWVLTIRVLEVNPELDSIRAQRGRARSALFSRVFVNVIHGTGPIARFCYLQSISSTKKCKNVSQRILTILNFHESF